MLRKLALIGLVPLLFSAVPAQAATKAQKLETCKFGADNDQLTGKKRDDFIKKCMANANYEPKARRDALKKVAPKKKKAVTKKKAAKPTAPAAPPTPPAPTPEPPNNQKM